MQFSICDENETREGSRLYFFLTSLKFCWNYPYFLHLSVDWTLLTKQEWVKSQPPTNRALIKWSIIINDSMPDIRSLYMIACRTFNHYE